MSAKTPSSTDAVDDFSDATGAARESTSDALSPSKKAQIVWGVAMRASMRDALREGESREREGQSLMASAPPMISMSSLVIAA